MKVIRNVKTFVKIRRAYGSKCVILKKTKKQGFSATGFSTRSLNTIRASKINKLVILSKKVGTSVISKSIKTGTVPNVLLTEEKIYPKSPISFLIRILSKDSI